MFRKLTPKEEKEFRLWARENYKPFTQINGVWHPTVIDECKRINEENSSTIITENGMFKGTIDDLKLFGIDEK